MTFSWIQSHAQSRTTYSSLLRHRFPGSSTPCAMDDVFPSGCGNRLCSQPCESPGHCSLILPDGFPPGPGHFLTHRCADEYHAEHPRRKPCRSLLVQSSPFWYSSSLVSPDFLPPPTTPINSGSPLGSIWHFPPYAAHRQFSQGWSLGQLYS